MLAVGAVSCHDRYLLSCVAGSAFSQLSPFSCASFVKKWKVLPDYRCPKSHIPYRVFSIDSGFRHCMQNVHPMCSVLYRLSNLNKAAFHGQHQHAPQKGLLKTKTNQLYHFMLLLYRMFIDLIYPRSLTLSLS